MTNDEAMAELASLGTEQNRKIYRRHGAREPLFGVSYAHQSALAKRLGTDHALAEQLWATDNHDARVLASMIADPAAMTSGALDAWAKSLRDHGTAEAFGARLVKHTRWAEKKRVAWRRSKRELVAETAWNLVAHAAVDGELDATATEPLIAEIEAGIHGAANRVKHAMNGALIAIGGIDDAHAKKAKAAATRIGEVVVDHGETSCKTPAAIPYIDKIRARAKARGERKAPKKKRVSNRAAR